jgi:hypothetical protein
MRKSAVSFFCLLLEEELSSLFLKFELLFALSPDLQEKISPRIAHIGAKGGEMVLDIGIGIAECWF